MRFCPDRLRQLNDFVRFGSILGVSVMGRGGLGACVGIKNDVSIVRL